MNVKSSPAYIDQLDKSTDEPSQIKTFSEAVKKVLYRDESSIFFVTSSTLNPASIKSDIF